MFVNVRSTAHLGRKERSHVLDILCLERSQAGSERVLGELVLFDQSGQGRVSRQV